MNRYYLTQRPPAPGTFPGKPVNMKAFDSREHVEEIGRPAWGWVEYEEPLTEKQIADYELVERQEAPGSKTITLTADQASTLVVYILTTTNYRKGEIEACSSLAQEKKEDGSPAFPNMKSNAEWWKNTHKELEKIKTLIDNAPITKEERK
jgi:hypothetical protein